MKCHARLHLVNQQLRHLTEGMIMDTYKAVEEGVEQSRKTEPWEIEMALDLLRDIDDLLVLPFDCGGYKLSISDLVQIAGCPWDVFVDSYANSRTGAVRCEGDGRRRELLLAAAKGVDGLEVLIQYVANKIDANDLLWFKGALIAMNLLTCAASFAWGWTYIRLGEVAPEFTSTTTVPSWQDQIKHIYDQHK